MYMCEIRGALDGFRLACSFWESSAFRQRFCAQNHRWDQLDSAGADSHFALGRHCCSLSLTHPSSSSLRAASDMHFSMGTRSSLSSSMSSHPSSSRAASDLHFSLGKHRSLSSSWSSRAMGMQGDCEGLHPSPSSSPSAPSPEKYDQLGAELRLPS
eukprot:6456373-Amphidinium_carterae.1